MPAPAAAMGRDAVSFERSCDLPVRSAGCVEPLDLEALDLDECLLPSCIPGGLDE